MSQITASSGRDKQEQNSSGVTRDPFLLLANAAASIIMTKIMTTTPGTPMFTPTKSTKMSSGVCELDKKLTKYWFQRYNLFSRYDEGIQMDDEAWYSVTPEKIALHIAKRFDESLGTGHKVIVDAFCGVGGNLIQFALHSPYNRVIGIDINPERIKMAKHNATIYGVQNQCEFILGDFTQIIHMLAYKVDAVFLSPPWGGIDYQSIDKYTLDHMTPNGYEIVRLCRQYLTENIALFLPRNIDLEQISKKLLSKKYPLFESESNMVGNKTKTITVYFGELTTADS